MDTVTLHGGFLAPARDSHIGKWQIESGRLDHDRFLVPLACEHVNHGDVVIDIGAYNGDWTIAFSEKVGAAGFVIAIEPNQEINTLLYKNVQRFPLNNTAVLNCAVGSEFAWCKYVPHAEGNFGMGYVRKDPDGDIPMQPLFGIARNETTRSVNFIKIDAEGWEFEVLRGAIKLLRDDKPTIIMEINPTALERNGTPVESIWRLLEGVNYVWQRLQPGEPRPGEHYDIIAMPIIFSEPKPQQPDQKTS